MDRFVEHSLAGGPDRVGLDGAGFCCVAPKQSPTQLLAHNFEVFPDKESESDILAVLLDIFS